VSKQPAPVKNVYPRDVKNGQEFAFGGVTLKLVEVNRLKHVYGPDTFIVAYQLIDARATPPYTSPVAHLFLNQESNLLAEMKKVVDLYEQIRESVLKVIIPKPPEKP